MNKRLNTDYIEDIINSINSIEKFVKNYSYEDFISDEKTYEAVIRKFGIIGEAANKISEDLKQKYSEIPWRAIIGMRNKVIHGYFGLDLATIWDTIENGLPEFKVFILMILENIQDEKDNL